MAVSNDLTTLVCLFHHQDQAQAALQDLLRAGIPQSSISSMDQAGYASTAGTGGGSLLAQLGVPEHDQNHLIEGLRNGGTIITVSAVSDHVDQVEDIFESHKAEQIDEAVGDDADESRQFAAGSAIPIVEEELTVGKRTVDQGGVRVYRRVVEIPVEETVSLREDHVNVARRAVDRPATGQDLAFQGDRTIELTETAEEAVIQKNARVVEEVFVGKDASQRTEHIRDTVRKTEVEVDEIAPGNGRPSTQREL